MTAALRNGRPFRRPSTDGRLSVAVVATDASVPGGLLPDPPIYGPVSLVLLLVLWAAGLVTAFGLLQYANGSAMHAAGNEAPGLATDLYLSGTTFFTLGLGDVAPQGSFARLLTVIESGLGFGFLASVIGSFPVIYQAFSRREVTISLLDARAGS